MKKIIYKWFIAALFSLLILGSCDKYLDVQPKGVQLLTTVKDYEEWLNSDKLEKSLPDELYWLTDNIDNVNISEDIVSSSERVYTWQTQFSEDLRTSPVLWSTHYYNIYYFNTVLVGIDDAKEGTEEQKESLKAEALLGRAFEYLYLVNLYGKVYNANTASQDLAVPFVTSNDLEDDVPDRNTVQEIYDQIIEDITTAIPNLPQNNDNNRFHGSVAAAYSVLARTYLYMGDYTKAAQNAQLALDNGPNTILDYSTMSGVADIPHLIRRSEAIYARLNKGYTFSIYPNLGFLQSFDTADLRLNFYYTNLEDYSFSTRGKVRYYSYANMQSAYVWPNWGTSVAEMRLILAEAAARANELSTACNELDLVRKCRFPEFIIDNTVTPPDTTYRYEKFESTDQEEVLQKVLDERRFEFAFTGMRWFDMRRLDAEDRMQAVNRYDGEDDLISTLSPGSAKYTLQIPIQVLYFNPDWPQNPTD